MGSFVLSNISIYGILNFVERGKCSTQAVNGIRFVVPGRPWRLELGPLLLPSCG